MVAADFIDDIISGKKQAIVSSIFGAQKSSPSFPKSSLQKGKIGFFDVKPEPFPLKKCVNCNCGLANVDRIVGGRSIRYNKYPWIAQLLKNGEFFCGGTLINDRYVLTAAHCFEEYAYEKLSVRILQYDRDSADNGIERDVNEVIAHTQYNAVTKQHDIALLRLNQTVKFSNYMRPICLPSNNNKNFEFREAIVAGWGLLEEFQIETSKILQEVAIPILTNAQCRATSYRTMILETMLCAGYVQGGKDACQGDSGGPLMIRDKNIFTLVGVVSFGYGCGQHNAPGVYTRVTKYLDWISTRTLDACYCSNYSN